jgi:hypothetical protein
MLRSCALEEKKAMIETHWISVEDKLPEYYDLVWASDGISVVLSRLVGRSYTPYKKLWANLERRGCDTLFGITHWRPAERPDPPTEF